MSMNPKLSTACLLVVAHAMTQAQAQIYYVPVEIPTHPSVNPVWFGESFGVDANRIYIGGLGSDEQFSESPGGVYQFNTTTLEYIRTYEPIGDASADTFGWSMEYYDGVLLVGAINAPSPGTFDIGAAYLIAPTTGALIQTFDEAANATVFSEFAIDLSINDVVIVIGAIGYDPNAAGQVFVYNAVNNALITALEPDPMTTDSNYGFQVDHNDDYLVVSAIGNRNAGIEGAVYVYDLITGELLHRFTSPVPDSAGTGEFGRSMELLGDTLFVGAGNSAPAGVLGTVTVYDIPTGNIITTLSGDGASDDGFGSAISAEDNTLVIGAQFDDSFAGQETGAVYIFDLTTYQQIDKVYPPASSGNQVLFGRNLRIQDGVILTSSFHALSDLDLKKAYVLREFCRPDLNLDGSIDFFDISAFIKFAIDFNNDGVFDFFDISDFLAAYQTPCP